MTSLCECGRPVQDAACCGACAGQLEDALRAVPDLAADLEVTRLRLARMGSRGNGGGADRLPWDQRAAEAAAVLRSALVGWVRVANEATGAHGASEGLPADTMAAMSAWLLRRVELIRHTEAASECVDEITAAVRNARRAIDRPPSMRYAGPCDHCGTDLLAAAHLEAVTCRECGAEYWVADRQAWMRDRLDDHLTWAANAVHLLASPVYGLEITPKMISRWVERGRLPDHGTDAKGRTLYRVGDIAELGAEHHERQAERQERRARRANAGHGVDTAAV